jgi:hypothetical protein
MKKCVAEAPHNNGLITLSNVKTIIYPRVIYAQGENGVCSASLYFSIITQLTALVNAL